MPYLTIFTTQSRGTFCFRLKCTCSSAALVLQAFLGTHGKPMLFYFFAPPRFPSFSFSPYYLGNIQQNKWAEQPPDRCHTETISNPTKPFLGCAPLQWGSRSQGFVTPHAPAAQMQGFSHDSHGPTWAVPQSHCSPGSTTRLPQTAPLRRDRRGLWKRHAPLPCFRKVSKSLMLQLLKAFAPLKWLK